MNSITPDSVAIGKHPSNKVQINVSCRRMWTTIDSSISHWQRDVKEAYKISQNQQELEERKDFNDSFWDYEVFTLA